MKYQEKYSYGGWKNCIYIDNGSISLVATADVGPRIMSFGFMDGLNVFHEDAADLGIINDNKWRIYGGTRLWHAPESLPRTYYPDNKPVKYHWNGEQLKLIQPKETTTGLQKEIIIKVSENQDMASIIYRIYNLNLWPVKFACWALSVMKQNGEVVVPHEPFQDHSENLLPARPLVLWRYTDMKDKRWEWGSRYIRLRQDPSTESSQ